MRGWPSNIHRLWTSWRKKEVSGEPQSLGTSCWWCSFSTYGLNEIGGHFSVGKALPRLFSRKALHAIGSEKVNDGYHAKNVEILSIFDSSLEFAAALLRFHFIFFPSSLSHVHFFYSFPSLKLIFCFDELGKLLLVIRRGASIPFDLATSVLF